MRREERGGRRRARELRGELRAAELEARDGVRDDARAHRGVDALAHGRGGRERDEALRELDERAERDGDGPGFLGRGRAEREEEDARQGLEAREGEVWVCGRERRERERREEVVVGRVCGRAQ